MAMEMARVRVPKTAEVIAQTLRSQIIRGEIPEGAPLPSEMELMEQFGVSRPSLREAFRILESERLIEVRRGSRGGACATSPDIKVAARYLGLVMQFEGVELRDVFTARALVEPLGLRLLANREDRQEVGAKVRAVIETIRATESPKEYANGWLRLFQVIFEESGNRSLALLYGALNEVVKTELEDATATAKAAYGSKSGGRTDGAVRSLEKALEMALAGRGAEASAYWTEQMLRVSDAVAKSHSGKTLVEVTDAY